MPRKISPWPGTEPNTGAELCEYSQEVVLDLPDAVQPEPVGQLDLFERIPQQLFLRSLWMRAWQLVLVK